MELWNYGAARSIWAHFSSPVFKLKIQLVPSQSSSQSALASQQLCQNFISGWNNNHKPVNLSIYQCQIGWFVIDHLTICISVKVKPVMLKNTMSYQFKVLLIANRVPILYTTLLLHSKFGILFSIFNQERSLWNSLEVAYIVVYRYTVFIHCTSLETSRPQQYFKTNMSLRHLCFVLFLILSCWDCWDGIKIIQQIFQPRFREFS